jgi:hypothetical protein
MSKVIQFFKEIIALIKEVKEMQATMLKGRVASE